MHISVVRRIRSSVCAMLCACMMFSQSDAGSGDVIKVPMAPGVIKNGIRAEIDCRWPDGHGYRPVKIKLLARRVNHDRTVRVVLFPGSPNKRRKHLAVTVDIEIGQGEREVTRTVYVPQQRPWDWFRAEFFLEGRRMKDLSMPHGFSFNNRYNIETPCLLMVDKDAPAIDDNRKALLGELRKEKEELSHRLPDATKFRYLANSKFLESIVLEESEDKRSDDYESLEFVGNTPNLEMLPLVGLPTDWIGLSGIDLIVISLADLTELSEQFPRRFESVDYFVRAGGNLVVHGKSSVAPASALFGHTAKWGKANQSLFRRHVQKTFGELVDSEEAEPLKNRQKVPDNVPDFYSSEHGLGKLVVIDSDQAYDQPAFFWQWVIRQIGTPRLTWSDRHGVSLVQSNNSYWDYMIPGFGASPVESFLGVITVFILCIGPVNYYLLNKSKRLYLLPITVGLAALLTTCAMMSYAVVKDGISTRVRLYSYTSLDQQHDESIASTHARQSYLAAFSPSDGLVFPIDTCIYPILPSFDYITESTLEREERVSDRRGERILSGDYMQARSTMQFLTTNVAKTDHGLEIDTADDGAIAAATNKLGVALTHIWIRDSNGILASASQVDVNQPLQLSQVEDKAAAEQFNGLAFANKPAPPEGLDRAAANVGLAFNNFANMRSRPVYTETSILRTRMKEAADFFKFPVPNSFIAVSKASPPFVRQGTQAQEEAGFHVIEGKW